MKLKVVSLANAVLDRLNACAQLSLDLCFSTDLFSGDATLRVLVKNPKPQARQFEHEPLIGKTIDVKVDVSRVQNFTIHRGAAKESVTPLGRRGAFAFVGRIIAHLNSGEGSLFQVGDLILIIEVRMVPPDSLEVYPNTWVSFSSEDLTFWMI